MKREDIIDSVHDRRKFLKLVTGGSLGALAGSSLPAAGQTASNDGLPPQLRLVDDIRDYVINSIDGEGTPYRGQVHEEWQRGERMFNAMIEMETRDFEVIYRSKHVDDPDATAALEPIHLNLEQFEQEEKEIQDELKRTDSRFGGVGGLLASKILAIFGVKDICSAVCEVFWSLELIQPLETAVISGQWRKAAKALGRILDTMTSRRFLRLLSSKVGTKTASRFVGKIGARCVPILGWLILIGSLVLTIRQQIANQA